MRDNPENQGFTFFAFLPPYLGVSDSLAYSKVLGLKRSIVRYRKLLISCLVARYSAGFVLKSMEIRGNPYIVSSLYPCVTHYPLFFHHRGCICRCMLCSSDGTHPSKSRNIFSSSFMCRLRLSLFVNVFFILLVFARCVSHNVNPPMSRGGVIHRHWPPRWWPPNC